MIENPGNKNHFTNIKQTSRPQTASYWSHRAASNWLKGFSQNRKFLWWDGWYGQAGKPLNCFLWSPKFQGPAELEDTLNEGFLRICSAVVRGSANGMWLSTGWFQFLEQTQIKQKNVSLLTLERFPWISGTTVKGSFLCSFADILVVYGWQPSASAGFSIRNRNSTDTCYCIFSTRICEHREFGSYNRIHHEKPSAKRVQVVTCKLSDAASKLCTPSSFPFLVTGRGGKRMIFTFLPDINSEGRNTCCCIDKFFLENWFSLEDLKHSVLISAPWFTGITLCSKQMCRAGEGNITISSVQERN